jgi:hypothetical protein
MLRQRGVRRERAQDPSVASESTLDSLSAAIVFARTRAPNLPQLSKCTRCAGKLVDLVAATR